jgi:hypothetical protein
LPTNEKARAVHHSATGLFAEIASSAGLANIERFLIIVVDETTGVFQ